MNRKFSVLTVVFAALALAACSPKSDDHDDPQPEVSIPMQETALQYASSVPGSQSGALNEAISSLYVLPVSSSNGEASHLQKLMKTDTLSPERLQSWMQARVQYVVDENFDFSSRVSVSTNPFTYQESSVLPDGFAAMKKPNAEVAQVMMANMGAWIYAKGKKLNMLVELDVPGIGPVSMTSPRTGLLQIGEGLFSPVSSKKTQNIVADIFRLGILFHEARHSDGHGKTLAFMHTVCPRGVYRGKAACDYAANGPYTVGASVLKALMNECQSRGTCTTRSNEVLKVLYLDQASRTLDIGNNGATLSSNARAGADWDDAPEGVR